MPEIKCSFIHSIQGATVSLIMMYKQVPVRVGDIMYYVVVVGQ